MEEVSDVKFSRSTQKHRNIIRALENLIGFWSDNAQQCNPETQEDLYYKVLKLKECLYSGSLILPTTNGVWFWDFCLDLPVPLTKPKQASCHFFTEAQMHF